MVQAKKELYISAMSRFVSIAAITIRSCSTSPTSKVMIRTATIFSISMRKMIATIRAATGRDEWCADHPGDPLCETLLLRAFPFLKLQSEGTRLFWWMMARLAGWTGVGPENLTISYDGSEIVLDWDESPRRSLLSSAVIRQS